LRARKGRQVETNEWGGTLKNAKRVSPTLRLYLTTMIDLPAAVRERQLHSIDTKSAESKPKTSTHGSLNQDEKKAET
jgi:hypothetical protein